MSSYSFVATVPAVLITSYLGDLSPKPVVRNNMLGANEQVVLLISMLFPFPESYSMKWFKKPAPAADSPRLLSLSPLRDVSTAYAEEPRPNRSRNGEFYLFIYIYVCVCVCEPALLRTEAEVRRKNRKSVTHCRVISRRNC